METVSTLALYIYPVRALTVKAIGNFSRVGAAVVRCLRNVQRCSVIFPTTFNRPMTKVIVIELAASSYPTDSPRVPDKNFVRLKLRDWRLRIKT